MCVELGFCQTALCLSILDAHSKLLFCLYLKECFQKKNLTAAGLRMMHRSSLQLEKQALAEYLNEGKYLILPCWNDALNLNNYWVSCMRISCDNYHHILGKKKQKVITDCKT